MRSPSLPVPSRESIFSRGVSQEQVRQVSTLPAKALLAYVDQTKHLSFYAQDRLARHPHKRIRRALARHRSLLPEIQAFLARDRDVMTRRSIAANPLLTPETAQQLFVDATEHGIDDGYVLQTLAKNIGTEPEMLRQIASFAGNSPLRLTLWANMKYPLSEVPPVTNLNWIEQWPLTARPDFPLDQLRLCHTSALRPEALARLELGDLAPIVTRWRRTWDDTLQSLLDALTSTLTGLSPVADMVARSLLSGPGFWKDIQVQVAAVSAAAEGLSPVAQEIVMRLFEEWSGSWEELFETAQNLEDTRV